jgi:hypothetical protein
MVHVDHFIKINVYEGAIDIGLFAVEIHVSHEKENNSKGGEFNGRCDFSVVIQPIDLREPLATESRLYIAMLPSALRFALNTHLHLFYALLSGRLIPTFLCR